MELNGKIAVVTGASRGLGLATARALANEGAAVMLAARSQMAIEQAAAEINSAGGRAAAFRFDASQPDQANALMAFCIQTFGRCDIWVNNAGVSAPYGPTAALSPDIFESVVHTNILGVYHGSLAAVRHFLARGSGKLVNVLGAGAKKPVAFQSAYASSKAWVRMFTLALAKETAGSGVGVFAIQPGLMRTDLIEQVEVVEGFAERMRAFAVVQRLWSKPPEVAAQKIVWLASSATDGKSGMELNVMTTGAMMKGALGELGRLISRKPAPPSAMTITEIPPDWRAG